MAERLAILDQVALDVDRLVVANRSDFKDIVVELLGPKFETATVARNGHMQPLVDLALGNFDINGVFEYLLRQRLEVK
jgi:hypothetical protein